MWCSIQLLAQSPATIRVPVRLVTARTLVFSKDGRLVPGLGSTDFPHLLLSKTRKSVDPRPGTSRPSFENTSVRAVTSRTGTRIVAGDWASS